MQAMDRPLTRSEKMRYRFHYLICTICRNFEKQIHALPELVRASFAAQEPAKPDPDFLAAVRAKLSEEPIH